MNPLTSLLRSFGSKKAASDDYPGTWIPVGGSADGINQRNLLEANKEWVFIAIDKVATAVASIRFKVMRYQRNGDDQEVFDGPLYDFLEAPGTDFTGKDFIYLNTVYKELAGNAFWERAKGQKVQPLIPTRVAPILSGGKVVALKYSDGAEQRTIQLKEVLHDRYIDPARPHWGVGKLQKIARWVDTSSYLGEFLSRFFVNGATFGGFIETEEETEQRIKLIKLGLANDHVGVANAHKLGVLPKGSKFSKVTANMAEMELGATDDRYRDKILSAFGIPKTLVGLSTEVNRATAEASEYIFAKYTVKPVADDLVEFLNVNVAPTFDPTGRFYFAYDEFVPVNQELQLKEREVALNKQPYMTVNEVRASVGLPKVEGGDTIYSSPGTPLGEPVIAPALPAANDDEPEDPKKTAPARVRRAAKQERVWERLAEKAVEIASAHHDPDAESHKSFVARVEDHEKLIADKVRDFNNRQEREVTQNLKQITKDVKKGDLFEMEREVSVLVDFVGPMLRGLLLEQALAEFATVADFPLDFYQADPSITRIVDLAARRLAKSYNNTTAKLLAKALNDGLAGGEDLTQLTERVRGVYDFSNTYRAAAVAKTEAFYIANKGSLEAYRQSGVVKSIRWYTAEDERVCPWCGPQHGRVVATNKPFFKKGEVLTADGKELTLDYRTIDVPPLHTNCRCFIRPEFIEV
ncbi:phage portal protein [Parerythrobacter lacustris]|uniref:Phage portal protein n=1 Tax=Parerythrobacter lacustris TaxID=2969984 RepID=A0ABT1XPA8_9SPHN|nr:phage portal protein [Parerythrobacter lacustris]MCR2833486.1 phage portal protein [Parerythrobacter lacustris]